MAGFIDRLAGLAVNRVWMLIYTRALVVHRLYTPLYGFSLAVSVNVQQLFLPDWALLLLIMHSRVRAQFSLPIQASQETGVKDARLPFQNQPHGNATKRPIDNSILFSVPAKIS
jgi:hypothetical protein